MQTLAQQGYSRAEVMDILHSQQREVRFRYELLDKTDTHLGWLDEVETAEVGNNSLADGAKRTAKFTISSPSPIDLLNDRIKPWFRIKAPGGEWLEWPLGVFLLSTPAKDVTGTGASRNIEAYDKGVILLNDMIDSRLLVPEGTSYTEAARVILQSAGIEKIQISESDEVAPVDREWDIGTSKRKLLNDIFQEINFQSLWFDVRGRARSQPYISPAQAAVGYRYVADDTSIITPKGKLEFDSYEVPNKFIVYVSEPDQPVMKSIYVNDDPNSPVSTVSRGAVFTKTIPTQASSQAILNAKAERLAFEASQVHEIAEFYSATMPHHEEAEVIGLQLPGVADSETVYGEHKWKMRLRIGAQMEHRVRRVVSV